jgi:hypothetical protein
MRSLLRGKNSRDRELAIRALREMVEGVERQAPKLVADFYRAAHQFHYATANSDDACTVGKARLLQTTMDLAHTIKWPPPAAEGEKL